MFARRSAARSCAPASPPPATARSSTRSTRSSARLSRTASRSRWPSRAPTRPGMEDDLFAPPAPPLPWVPSIDSEPRTRNAKPKTEIAHHGAGAQPRAAQDPHRAPRVPRPRPGHRHLRRRVQGHRGSAQGFRPAARDEPAAGRERHARATPSASRVNGHRPIEEFQFADFSTEATTQIVLNAAHVSFPLGRRGAAGAAPAVRRRAHLRLVPLAGARVVLPLDARPQGALPQQPAGRLQRAARRLRGRQPRAALRAQGALPPRQASGHVGSALPRRVEPASASGPAISRPSSPTARWCTWPARSATTSPPNTSATSSSGTCAASRRSAWTPSRIRSRAPTG